MSNWLDGLHPDGAVSLAEGTPDFSESRAITARTDPNGNLVVVIVGETSHRCWIDGVSISVAISEVSRLKTLGLLK